MNQQQERAIVEGLRALAATTNHGGASPHVERAVLAAMNRGSTRRHSGWFVHAVAAALLLISISGSWLAWQSAHSRPGSVHPEGFVEIPGASTLPPMESGSIVRVALPVTVLPQYGLAILPDVAGDTVLAELLIAQDGLPRMIRLAQDDSTRSTP